MSVPQPAIVRGLIDSNVLIDAHRNYPPGVAFVTTMQAAGPPDISIVTSMELIEGCQNGMAQSKMVQTLGFYTAHPITSAISDDAYRLILQFFLSHSLKMKDALIAATARDLGLPIYTHNAKHFSMIPNVQVLKPY